MTSLRVGALTVTMAFGVAAMPAAQQQQNPSPMVEHTRPHPRYTGAPPPGRREALTVGTLFIPKGVTKKARLVIHFHGGPLIPEVAAARLGGTAVISASLGVGSGVYSRAFAEASLFTRLIAEAEAKSQMTFSPIILSSWSAGYGATRAILRVPAHYARVSGVLLVDSMHASYVGDTPSTVLGQDSALVPEDMRIFADFARDASLGRKRMIATHTEIFPGTYASTTEVGDWLAVMLGLKVKPVLKWGPAGTQQLGEVKKGKFQLLGYAGNTAPDHLDQLEALPEFLKWMR